MGSETTWIPGRICNRYAATIPSRVSGQRPALLARLGGLSSGVAQCDFVVSEGQVVVDHQFDELGESHLRFPAELRPGLRRIAKKQLDLRGTVIARIDVDVLLPVEIEEAEGRAEEFADRVSLSSCNHIVIGFRRLHHQPHGLDVVARVTPVATRVEVAEVELLLESELDAGRGA